MRWFVSTVICGVLAVSLIHAQDQKKPTELQIAEAKLVKMQLQYLDLQKQLASCQEQVLGGVAKAHEEKILKDVEAKPGQKFDWNNFTITPIPAAPTQSKP